MYGGIALRHELSNVVMWLGHIGYGIRPSARRHGLAAWTLGRMLDEARELGLNQMRIICEADNLAPAKSIERQGGVLALVRDTGPAPRGVTGSRSASRARHSRVRSRSTGHRAPPALSASSVVREIGIIYVRRKSVLGYQNR